MNEKDFVERDLWWEGRLKSAKYRGNIIERVATTAAKTFGLIRPVPLSLGLVGFETGMMMVDLNKYRPDVDVELLIDQGVRLFGLRVMGPTRWVYANWAYEVDKTFVPYYERIRAYAAAKGVRVYILGYGIHNAWSNEEGNYLGLDPQVKMLKEATRNHQCDLYCWDDEVATCWKDNKETTITPTNLVRSIKICMQQTKDEMERWPDGSYKIPVHYTGVWFMKQYAPAEYRTWKDNASADPANRHFLNWYAYLPYTFKEVWANISMLFDKLPTPTGLQENAYLKIGGNEPPADLWQCTFTAKGPWSPDLGCDASITYGLSRKAVDFVRNANLPLGPVVSSSPSSSPSASNSASPSEAPDDYAQLRADVDWLLDWQSTRRTG